MIHFHFDLDINLECIEAIIHLLNRTDEMQKKITWRTNRFKVYEP
ncbi:chaperone modulator CbpM [Chryseolinea lacunae]